MCLEMADLQAGMLVVDSEAMHGGVGIVTNVKKSILTVLWFDRDYNAFEVYPIRGLGDRVDIYYDQAYRPNYLVNGLMSVNLEYLIGL